MFKLPLKDPVAERVLAEEIIRQGRREGMPLSPQHLEILKTLFAAYGIVSFKTLGRAIRCGSKRPSGVLRTRMPVLRKAVAPYGYRINAYRHLGYAIYQV